MKETLKKELDIMSSFELACLKVDVHNLIKEKRKSEKKETKKMFEYSVNKGDKVSFIFKNEEFWGNVVKVNDATFTVEFVYKGEEVKKAIQFHKFVVKADDVADEAPAYEEIA